MREKSNDNFLILFLTMIVLIFQGRVNNIIIFAISSLVWVVFYKLNKNDKSIEFILTRMLVLSVPLSFTSISGKLYSQSIVSWFNIFFMILTCLVIIRGMVEDKLYLDRLSLFSLYIMIIGLVPIFISEFRMSALKQYINFIVPFILIVIGNNIKYSCNEEDKESILKDYVFATNITGIGVFMQFIIKNIFNITLGNYAHFGGYRHAYGFLFADFSFLSLYLVTGSIILLKLVDNDKMDKKRGCMNILFLVLASIITSARTGVFSFIVVFGLFMIPKFFRYLLQNFPRALLIMLSVVVLLGSVVVLFDRVRGNRKFNDSGRGSLNEIAFKLFLDNPIFGVGFGSSNYTKIAGMLPHNLIFQYLAQGGLFFALPLFIILYVVLSISKKKDGIVFMTILCILVGSLFIPNIFNSRFLGIVFLIFSIRNIGCKEDSIKKDYI